MTLRDVETAPEVEGSVLKEEPLDVESISFKKARMLVVDDVRTNRLLLREWLAKVNLEVKEAENGREALTFAEEFRPDIILMDIVMPVMDGIKAAKLLRADSESRHIPLIALTGTTRACYN